MLMRGAYASKNGRVRVFHKTRRLDNSLGCTDCRKGENSRKVEETQTGEEGDDVVFLKVVDRNAEESVSSS